MSVKRACAVALDDVAGVLNTGDIVMWGRAGAGVLVLGRNGAIGVWTAGVGDTQGTIEPLWAICSGAAATQTVRCLTFASPHLARAVGPRLRAHVQGQQTATTAVSLVVQTYMRIGLIRPCKAPQLFQQLDLLLHGDLDSSVVPGVVFGPDFYVTSA